MVRWLVGIIVMDVAVACLILFGCCQVEVLAVFSHDRADSPPAGSVLGRLTAAVHAPMTYVAVFIFSLPPASLSLSASLALLFFLLAFSVNRHMEKTWPLRETLGDLSRPTGSLSFYSAGPYLRRARRPKLLFHKQQQKRTS
jgi:hypothetical protein